MELRQLEHFVTVAEEQHFTRAAARVHVVQSSLSASIKALERELGEPLFVRDNRRVTLTQAGRALSPCRPGNSRCGGRGSRSGGRSANLAVARGNQPDHRLSFHCTVTIQVQTGRYVQESVGMKTLELVFFDAGGGHRSAANALCEVVRRQDRPWDMRMMNLQELLDEMDVFRKLTGIRLQDIYNLLLRRGWTLGSPALMKGMHGVIRALHPKQVKLLVGLLARTTSPDMVVSVIPNFNRAIYQAMQRVMPDVPLVTILTDMADYPPHFWIERQPQYLICGTERAYDQALQLGHSPERVFRTSGMILNPRYYEPVAVDRGPDRAALGLDPDRPTALMMFGGEGSAAMLDIARQLDASGLDVQIIAICGKNKKLEAALRAMPRRIAMHVEGFTREVPRFMRLADFFIGKPGPGSISEAVAMGLPGDHRTQPLDAAAGALQRRLGGRAGRRHLAAQFQTRRSWTRCGRCSIRERRCEFVKHVNRQKNRAVFEIPEILDRSGMESTHLSSKRRPHRNDMPAKLTTLCGSMFHCSYRSTVPRACGIAFRNV